MSETTYSHLLRIEAVNFGHFIFDVNDLSTARGGGLLLLEAITRVAKLIEQKGGKTISSGASVGLFGLVASSNAQAGATAKHVRDELNRHTEFQHATFVVDVVATTSNTFRLDCERVLALNRRQQLAMPAMQVPAPGNGVCKLDRIRPASGGAAEKDKAHEQSHSVNARRTAGRERKQATYVDILRKVAAADAKAAQVLTYYEKHNLPFAGDFHQISNDRKEIRGNLGDKIAVFYADGNSFSRFNRVESATALEAWDVKIKHLRGTLLARLLDVVHPTDDDTRIRIETLLWGGDELIFVLPAWKGIEFAEIFFETTKSKDWEHNGKRLTHAVGLVFCHHNAPIQPIQALARRLGDIGKSKAGRDVNSINCVVLESFDHTGLDWDAYLARISANTINAEMRVLRDDVFTQLVERLQQIKAPDGLPRSRLYAYLRDVLDAERQGKSVDAAASQRLTHDLVGDIEDLVSKTNNAEWMLLTELWDYVDAEDLPAVLTTESLTREGAAA